MISTPPFGMQRQTVKKAPSLLHRSPCTSQVHPARRVQARCRVRQNLLYTTRLLLDSWSQSTADPQYPAPTNHRDGRIDYSSPLRACADSVLGAVIPFELAYAGRACTMQRLHSWSPYSLVHSEHLLQGFPLPSSTTHLASRFGIRTESRRAVPVRSNKHRPM